MTSSNESEEITFATPIENSPCEHDMRMVGMDMINIYWKCLYCDKSETDPRLKAMNC